MKINLTELEAECIAHRADIPDCIAEVYGPENENRWPNLDAVEVEERVEALIAKVFDGKSLTVDPDDEDQVEIASELFDGNALPFIFTQDVIRIDPEAQKRADKYIRAMRSINRKLEAANAPFQGFAV